MNRILIAEDEARIASFIEKGLRANGFTISVAADGQQALALARSGDFDLLILDIGLPGKDGFEILRELRAYDSHLPVIVLTARTGVGDTVSGLEGGADDYVHKPFRFEELLARVRVRLRGERAPEETVLRVGNCALDLRTRRAQVSGRTVELTAREFAMAEMFFRHPDQVLSREQLLSHVWGYDYDPGSNIVDVYVGYLRKKLGENRIATVRGMGYRLSDGKDADGRSGQRFAPGPRVLLVEDDARIARMVARGLSEQGEVLVAEDGDVGLFLGTTEDFDAVILDLGLPGTSGLEVLRRIRAEHAGVPIIVITGRDDPSARKASLAAGATAFLTKPFAIEELRQVVRTSSRSVAGASES
jgi:two-component system, OmpR family, copper resistance phosphate regulon response regulator CusR